MTENKEFKALDRVSLPDNLPIMFAIGYHPMKAILLRPQFSNI